MTRALFFDALLQDIKFATRTLARQRGWTAIAILTLTLGIGANTAVFSVVNSLLLHPLAYPGADRLVLIKSQVALAKGGKSQTFARIPDAATIRNWRDHARSFDAIEPVAASFGALSVAGAEPTAVHTATISASFLAFADRHPLLGRGFAESDIRRGAERVAMVSEALWRGRYGSDPALLGRVIRLEDSTYTVIGIMPATLQIPQIGGKPIDLWLPFSLD